MGGRLRDALFLIERRRRRRVAKLLRQMDRLDAGQPASPWRSYPAAQSPAGAHQHRRAMTAVLVVILGLGGVMAWSMYDTSPDRSPVFASRPDDSQDSRLEPSVAAKSDSKDYAFLQTQDGSDEPVTYDPCAPIHLVVNPRTIVEGGMRLLDEALDDVRAATGLTFEVDGLSDVGLPVPQSVTVDDGQRWRPVSVHWSDPQEDEELAGDVAGRGGSTAIVRDGRSWFVTGSVVLDGPQLAKLLKDGGGRTDVRSVILHELGHLVGLDHVDAAGQLMQPRGDGSVRSWGEGDRAGLALLGDGPCIDY